MENRISGNTLETTPTVIYSITPRYIVHIATEHPIPLVSQHACLITYTIQCWISVYYNVGSQYTTMLDLSILQCIISVYYNVASQYTTM